ncbi:MAG: hypothetical protein WBN65_13600 [Gammaproteobacteria bacterium]
MDNSNSTFARTFADLRRRRVFRVAATYAVVAWLVIEVASVVFPALHVPEWGLTVVVSLALIGFPVVLLLGWLFDITPSGLVKTEPLAQGAREVHRVARRAIDFVVIGVLLAIIGYLVHDQNLIAPWVGEDKSIAVLPFVDLSQEGDNEYFSDGISEELLNSLVGVDGLRVAARTSSFAFKNRNEDIRAIGEQLNVETVLEGSVRRSGDQVRITAQLINVDDGFHLWSSTYDRRLDDIFSIQAEIAQSIVDALKLQLIGDSQVMVAASADVDIRAYDLYLLGRHHWHQRTPESLNRALELFQQAIAIEASFALAYTGLADTYLLLDGYGDLSTEDALSRAELPVARALALDDQLAEAYASLGLLRFNQKDISAAELALRKAVDLNPNYSMAHMWLGLVLDRSTGPEASLAEYRRAMEVDPLHPVVQANFAQALGATGRYQDAVSQNLALLQRDPGIDSVYFTLAQLHERYGQLGEAATIAGRGIEQTDGPLSYLALATAVAKLGDLHRATAYLREARERLGDSHKTLGAEVSFLLALGDMGAADALLDAEQLGDKIEDDDWATMERMYWAGFVAMRAGDYDIAINRLEAVRRFAGQMMGPEESLRMASILAYAQRGAGNEVAAAQILEDAISKSEWASKAGWRLPQIDALAALCLHMAGQEESARARLAGAVAAGWRDYHALRLQPEAADWFSQPGMSVILDPVRRDLESMRAGLRDLPAVEDRVASLQDTAR